MSRFSLWVPSLPFSSNHASRLKSAFLNLLFPKLCLACREVLAFETRQSLCLACAEQIAILPDPICKRCGVCVAAGEKLCRHCAGKTFAVSVIRSAVSFHSPIQAQIHHLKYSGRENLLPEFVEHLLGAWQRYSELAEAQVVVPVALDAATRRERGFSSTEKLAQLFVRAVNERKLFAADRSEWLSCQPQALVRRKKLTSQTRLSRVERLKNVRDNFAASSDAAVLGKTVLLIDDVCTTGATLNACAEALLSAGARQALALTLARD